MWLPFSQNPFCKFILGTVFAVNAVLCPALFAQTESPLNPPAKTSYPGMLESFEKLIKIDADRFHAKVTSLARSAKILTNTKDITALDLDPDFLNSVILHSAPGYLKLASMEKCRLYDSIITDLLRSTEGKIKNVIVTYVNAKSVRETALMNRKDFLNKVVSLECPQTQKLIAEFQIRNIDRVINATSFEMPTGDAQCKNIVSTWLHNPRTPYLCQLHEYMKEASLGEGDPQDLAQRRAVAKVLEGKLNLTQKDYLANLCTHLDDEKFFCQEFLNVSFWNKIANGFEDRIYAEDICLHTVKGTTLNETELKNCLSRMKQETDLCLYPSGHSTGLTPHMECDIQSLALNYSSLRSNYRDCPNESDQQAVTNLARIILHTSKEPIKPYQGPCSAISSGEVLAFDNRFDNQDKWELEACFTDKVLQRDQCFKTFFGQYGTMSESYTMVVADILRRTKGVDPAIKCEMVSSTEYSPQLLKFKSGCFIIYEDNQCFISHCPHRIEFNGQPFDIIKLQNEINFDYFATNVRDERFAQHYVLTTEFKLRAKTLNNLTSINAFFKKTKKGIIHGIACAEDVLPSFFKSHTMNQCTPVPFIIDGMIKMDDKTVFVTRTAFDSLQAPRIVSWANIYSGVKAYQRFHPLRLWTMYGLD
jgi:hypothetical protein